MPKQLVIPDELLVLYPDFNRQELRAIINVIWKSKSNKLRQSNIFHINLPHIGILKSHGNKKHKYSKKRMKYDRKRKNRQNLKKQFERKNLLY